MADRRYMEIEREGDTLIVVCLEDFAALGDAGVAAEWSLVREEVDRARPARVVVDLSKLPYFGSTVIEWMVQLWKRVRAADGAMAVCGLSTVGRESIGYTRLDTVWTIADTRAEAIAAVDQALRKADAS